MTQPVVRLFQSTCVDGDVAHNLDAALRAIADSTGRADLIVFPETFIPGFPTPENVAKLAEPIDGTSISAIRAAARAARVSVAIGFAESDGGHYYNTALLIDEHGHILLKYRKTHLYASDIGVFERGQTFPVCEWHGIRVGMLICFDIEFPETARILARNGAELMLVLDGLMCPYGNVHRTMLPVRAMENQAYMVLVNRAGPGDRYTFAGQSHVADPFGCSVFVADAERADPQDVRLDMSAVARSREAFSYVELTAITVGETPMPPRGAISAE
ncbi:carbon-nitrogen hydrolase family protein [Burkholderia multivorans]|uniref:Predicted amidohydrolase n=1 Tax=Burkholderia multivorans (strain ATCC 17616 / 249) TaxID=395019 RepID=A0A0H3KJY6_BURM1|nr:carbon-nitrogen hydrolase family protein [Burkholderia multivorans]ABX18688.1 Nitrilase/cyanide hydratase and apolipoprotein N-acyltransferase [Burkholderia multivorans ATCC 17616]MCO8578383.1 carbon-nitrogen hydrolase family protein [Burkholderia multivorans]PRE09876.1 amidohydrolase [Burkholderia multivorans]PRF56916.1 amidohydrolase [Burkholderia multivorans]BAG45367.1 predicted amidohydrolase [Burkholderia multivorans ATCC 17616]